MSKENCGCGHDHAHDHEHNHEECGCGCGHDHEEALVITLDDGKGNEEQCIVIDSFEYEENEYLLAQSQKDESVYLFKMVGEELVYPEEEEFNKVTTYYNEVLVQQD
ncbi:MAG: DUF1292 domain-containing protein [Clostridium sp.]|nr:DUF1292 domain-containing protein [Clostridium sp.]